MRFFTSPLFISVVHLAKKKEENVVEIIDLTDADEEIKAERGLLLVILCMPFDLI